MQLAMFQSETEYLVLSGLCCWSQLIQTIAEIQWMMALGKVELVVVPG